jgi:hypothetical protein
MMQQPKIALGFAYTRCRANFCYNFWKRSRLSEKKREKERVTPEFGERKEEKKILPPNSERYSFRTRVVVGEEATNFCCFCSKVVPKVESQL